MDPLDNVDSSSDAIQIQYVTREEVDARDANILSELFYFSEHHIAVVFYCSIVFFSPHSTLVIYVNFVDVIFHLISRNFFSSQRLDNSPVDGALERTNEYNENGAKK
jgi:hypothetical protein